MIEKILTFLFGILGSCFWLLKSIRTKIRNCRARHPKHIYPGDPEWKKYLDGFEAGAKGVDQIAPSGKGYPPLQAKCFNPRCDFEHAVALPPKGGDLISWGSSVQVRDQVTKWPICPKCRQPTLTWIRRSRRRV
jgi:hypothetical protein